MSAFLPLILRRSDGQDSVIIKDKGLQTNCPDAKQLDRTPDAKGVCDYYREVPTNDPKYLEWCRKLGGMLARALRIPDSQGASYIMYLLPEKYRLWEHVKTQPADANGKPAKSPKNHAAGGHDRQDAYLYGHPAGPQKRYRSPADFFPHLLWLATDETGNRDNCSCKMCCPQALEGEEEKGKDGKDNKGHKSGNGGKKGDGHPKSPPKGSGSSTGKGRQSSVQDVTFQGPSGVKAAVTKVAPAEVARKEVTGKEVARKDLARKEVTRKEPAQTPAAPKEVTRTEVPRTESAKAQAAGAQMPVPSVLPQPRNVDQQLDLQFNKLLFRSGEVVWFKRGEIWGLGVIVRRLLVPRTVSQNEERTYVVQPLSHPFAHPDVVHLSQEQFLRPWLAWTPPEYTCQALNTSNVKYDTVDWRGLNDQKYGPCDAEIDGSILAAKAVDGTFTVFHEVKRIKPFPETEEIHWNGLYLGGEKLWAGDTARLLGNSAVDVLILVITSIVERTHQQDTTVNVLGDIYRFETVSAQEMDIPSDQGLPSRMREDLRFRNNIIVGKLDKRSYWKLIQAGAAVDAGQIQGRWYESSLLMPIIDEPKFVGAIEKGEASDIGQWLNARGHSNPDLLGAGLRKMTRIEAFGKAVPPETSIVEGVDPTQQPARVTTQRPPNQQPQQVIEHQRQNPGQNHQQRPVEHDQLMQDSQGALDEFMNLEASDTEPGSGPGQDFNSHYQRYY